MNPKVEETDSSALLGLAGGIGGQSVFVNISGQIKKAGIALGNIEIKAMDPSFSSNSQTNSSTTNSAGRFYLSISTGFQSLQFSDAGTIVNILLQVTPFSATVLSLDNSGYQIQSLDVYNLDTEAPLYLELSVPYDGLLIDNGNFSLISGGFAFTFSEDIEMPSNQTLWVAENFLVNPSITLLSPSISKNNVQIMINNGDFTAFTPYTITLNTGIKSVTGKIVKPITIQFAVGGLFL
ncbi:hypothetical protein ACO2KH_07115 [Leptospira terpstrae]|uniref:hypothetical protein n=1 Tax=Leptospira terpstrae TaxID=293075 RepID=UPI003CFF34B2